jgi:N-sulfoglucosamine sulfohydrolase
VEAQNVLLYVVDDQGSGDAGCLGNPVIRTPGLDALAANGVRMTRAFCTTPSCSASRSTILTGLHNHANGLYGHEPGYTHFPSFNHVESLPVTQVKAGDRPLRAGKLHVAPESVYQFDGQLTVSAPTDMAEKCRAFIEAQDDKPFFLYFCTTEPHRPFRREGSQQISPREVIVPD